MGTYTNIPRCFHVKRHNSSRLDASCVKEGFPYLANLITGGPNYVGVRWTLNLEECMKINKIRPKFHFLTKIEMKMTSYLVFCFFTVSTPLEPFGSRFINVFKSLRCTKSTVRKNLKIEDNRLVFLFLKNKKITTN